MMFDEILLSLASIAKDIVGNRIKQINEDLYQKKVQKQSKLEIESERKRAGIENLDLETIGRIRRDIKLKTKLEFNEKVDISHSISTEATKSNIVSHLHDLKSWSSHFSFSDLNGKKTLSEIYIELETYLIPSKLHMHSNEKLNKIPLISAVLNDREHSVIYGQPGAGKTTSIKKICHYYFRENKLKNHSFPIVIRCRDLSNNDPRGDLIRKIHDIFIVTVSTINLSDISDQKSKDLNLEVFLEIVDNFSFVLILDGFDEVSTYEQKEMLQGIIREISRVLVKSKIIITCRTGEKEFSLINCKTYEIAPLSNMQILDFVYKWVDNAEKSKSLFLELKNSPYFDTAIKPLTLAHLCAIYDRIGFVPEKPKSVYKKVVALMLEEWDGQRGVKRFTTLTNFDSDRKIEFLSNISYILTTKYRSTVLDLDHFLEAYSSINEKYRLSSSQGRSVLEEIESQTGLFVRSGHNSYEFSHKSIQEYLAAEYIVRLPAFAPDSKTMESLADALAIAVSISSDSNQYFYQLYNKITVLESPLSESFYRVFSTRLIQETPDFIIEPVFVMAFFGYFNSIPDRKVMVQFVRKFQFEKKLLVLFDYYTYVHEPGGNVLIFRKHKKVPNLNLPEVLGIPKGIGFERLLVKA